ncbi:DUF5368 domain-containing protein [Advenella sp. RU8]|uniref:DUF5368 domain-containing protein n=1 Tax=Advenella sp. RU8 TaxID=3399575 RepID=UPI003AADE927
MQELTVETLIAVFEQMFGPVLFWVLVAAVIVITVAYVYVLIRDRSISMHKFLWAQVSMPIGAILAIWFVFASTDSRLADIGGPVDIIMLLAIGFFGAVGFAVLVYTAQALISPPSKERAD